MIIRALFDVVCFNCNKDNPVQSEYGNPTVRAIIDDILELALNRHMDGSNKVLIPEDFMK